MSAIPLTPAEWVETFTAIAIFTGAVVLAIVVPAIVAALVRGRNGGAEVGEMVVRALRGPVGAFILVQAFFIALRTLSYLRDEWHLIERGWLAASILVLTYAIQRVVARLTLWYAGRSVQGRSRIDARTVPLLRRAFNVVIWVVGGLIVLDTVGIQISPLLAGLGIGGLAVALALQPMLANVFASSYMLSDRSIHVGDAIQVQGGPAGIIEDIGWRATRIRSLDHNLVIVPNSVLAASTVTNFDASTPDTDVTLTLRVSGKDDLAAVEAACVEELTRLCEEADGLVLAGAPVSVRFQAIVDGKAELLLRIRAASWREVNDLRHRMIVRIQSRLQAEGVSLV
ncbi:MAG: mechanosensitive ion channel family protein [Dehalococcoidia bacterium]